MATPVENTYEKGERIRCRAVFTDPETTTALTATVGPGQTVLPVRSGILGAGFPAGAPIVVGKGQEADFLTVAAPGATATGIPVTSPVLHSHHPGEKVALLDDPEVVTFTIKAPNRAPTTPANTRDQTGVYHAGVVGNLVGTWVYRAEGNTGGVFESAFRVVPSGV